jgi:hypothetical protein
MTKQNADDRNTPGRIMIRAMDLFSEIGNQWPHFRRIFASFMRGNVKRLRPDDAGNAVLPLSIDIFEQAQRMRAEISYLQDPVRYRAIVDHSVRRTGDEVKNADLRELDEPSDQNHDQ